MKPLVYFIRNPDDELIKIGKTIDLHRRMQMLRVQTRCKNLEIIGVIDGGSEKEEELHAKFSKNRKFGEWFSTSHDMDQFISLNTYKPNVDELRKHSNNRRFKSKSDPHAEQAARVSEALARLDEANKMIVQYRDRIVELEKRQLEDRDHYEKKEERYQEKIEELNKQIAQLNLEVGLLKGKVSQLNHS